MQTIAITLTYLWIIFWVGVVILHLWLALYVLLDAKVYNIRQGLFLDSPILWGLIVLITGIAGMALYWIIHYSSFRRISEK